MFEKYFPDETVGSTYEIDYEKLYEEGYRGLLFDIDNTLVKHGEMADDRSKTLFIRLRKIGFECCLISNNKKRRVYDFNEDIGVHTIFNAHKPAAKGYFYAMELMNTNLNNTVFIGDQLFTDIFGAKKIGMKNYLVSPINKREEIQIVMKRKLENVVLSEYRAKLRGKIEKLEQALGVTARRAERADRAEHGRIWEQIRRMKAQERVLRIRKREVGHTKSKYHILKRQW